MKKKLGLISIILVLVALAACGKEKSNEKAPDTDELLPLEVELTVQEAADVDEVVKMEALVTQGEEKIDDADEVEFEIWEEGKKEESIKVSSKNDKNGLYSAENTFEHDGVFTIQVHVTARNMHTMPMKVVTVGNGSEHDKEGAAHEHGSAEGFSMHFMGLEKGVAKEDSLLVTHLQMEGKPLEKVKVRYEIWKEEKTDKHDWLDTEEIVAGEYSAKKSFNEAGNYKVQVHVEDDHGLHEHEEHLITIK